MEVLQTYEHQGMALHLTAYQGPAPDLGSETGRSVSRAPGAGGIELSALAVEHDRQGLTLTARASGRNLAFLYTEVLLKDKSRESFYGPVWREHIRADREKETGGVARPDWDEPVSIRVGFSPSLRLLSCGTGSASAFCFAVPERYAGEEYRVSGLYTLAGAGASLRTVLVFGGDGALSRAMGYGTSDGRSGPRGLTPKAGDRFAPFAQVLTKRGAEADWEVAAALADEVTLGPEPLRVLSQGPLPGEYLVGVLAQDFDGGLTRAYVTVRLGG